MTAPATVVRRARFPDDAEEVLKIWREYIASPTVSLAFQDNETEFAGLPGKYAAPGGGVLLADRGGRIVGCIAFRRVNDTICEMKRLYIRPEARGAGLGRRLVLRLLEDAAEAGYDEMRLDVLPEFAEARKLYVDLGFAPADPVTVNPVPGTSFLGRRLGPAKGGG